MIDVSQLPDCPLSEKWGHLEALFGKGDGYHNQVHVSGIRKTEYLQGGNELLWIFNLCKSTEYMGKPERVSAKCYLKIDLATAPAREFARQAIERAERVQAWLTADCGVTLGGGA